MTSAKDAALNNQKASQKLVIRALANNDLFSFIDLWNEAFESDPYAFRTSLKKWKQKQEVEIERDFLLSIRKKNFILGAFLETKLVGMVGISHHKDNFTLWGTFVRSSCRGKNIGHDLIVLAIEKLVSVNPTVQHLYLEVFSSAQAARSMYKQMGFREIETKSTGEILAVKNVR